MPDETNTYIEYGIRSFDRVRLPPILYKYRDWNKPLHKRILTENEVYLASPGDFLDEYDCKIPIRYDLLSDNDIIKKYFERSKIDNKNFTRQQHRNYARLCKKKGLLRDEARLKGIYKDYLNQLNNRFGVLSLSTVPNSIKMWVDYSNNHKGFCVGFNSRELCSLSNYIGGGGYVKYYNELPIIKETDSIDKKHSLQIFSKLREWAFESEYRLTKLDMLVRRVPIPSQIYKEIVLGHAISDIDKNEILSIASEKFPNARISQAVLNDGSIELIPIVRVS